MPPGTDDRSSTTVPAAHSDATLRAVGAARKLIESLKDCEAAICQANESVDSETLGIVAHISRSVAAAREQADLLQQRVKQIADDRSGFWEPARLGRRTQSAG